MMSSELIRGQADANDVSPSGKLMLKYGPGWTIRGAQAGPMGTKEEVRSGEEEDCTTAKGGGETRLLRVRLMNRRAK